MNCSSCDKPLLKLSEHFGDFNAPRCHECYLKDVRPPNQIDDLENKLSSLKEELEDKESVRDDIECEICDLEDEICEIEQKLKKLKPAALGVIPVSSEQIPLFDLPPSTTFR